MRVPELREGGEAMTVELLHILAFGISCFAFGFSLAALIMTMGRR